MRAFLVDILAVGFFVLEWSVYSLYAGAYRLRTAIHDDGCRSDRHLA
jgi:hypothetical protein